MTQSHPITMPRETLRLDLRFQLRSTPAQAFHYLTEVRNWPEYWAGFVRFADPARLRWRDPGDRIRLVVKLLGREREVELELQEFEPVSRVIYLSRQRGLPEARHQRQFTALAEGCEYRVIVECARRRGLMGIIDRTLVKNAVSRTVGESVERIRSGLAKLPAGFFDSSVASAGECR